MIKIKEFLTKNKIPTIIIASILVVAIASTIVGVSAYRNKHQKPNTVKELFSQKINSERQANSSNLKYKKSGKGVTILGFKDANPDYTLVSIPDNIDGKPVTKIAPEAFIDNTFLETVIFGSNIKEIGASAFENCASLKVVALGKSVETVQAKAFNGCVSLRAVSLNDGLVSIGSECFKNTAITSVYIPSTVKEIIDAFSDNITITGSANSYASDWAEVNRFRFKAVV